MSKLSDDEQLVKLILIQAKIMLYWSQDDDDNMKKLLSRLERGRKAMEAMEKIAKARLEDDYDEFAADVDLILRKYQQSCKEAADGN